MTARQLHINVNVLSSGSHPASWRAPYGNRFGYIEVEHYQQIARIAERGLLDAVFLADALAIAPDPRFGPMWALDPTVIVTAMAGATDTIGFIASSSTTFNDPYNVARTFVSLDHASHGRVGWNAVTTYDERAAPNFGLKNLPAHEDRYCRATEFVEVVLALWDSWEDSALVGDKRSGLFADTSKIHRIDHDGPHFTVTGPLQIPRSPQGRPLLVQAGSSEPGRAMAARYAEAVFSVFQVKEEAQAFCTDVKERARRFGRNSDQISLLPGLTFTLGGTEAEAKARRKELDDIADDGRVLDRFAARLGVDVSELDFDQPFPEKLLGKVKNATGSRGFADATLSLVKSRTLTIREIIARGGGAHRTVAGAPEQIADTIEDWFVNRAADGFNIMADVYPSGLEAFVDQVVPLLQKRGLFRREYTDKTLRDHYGLPRPPSMFETDERPQLRAAG